jgi:hypothetical protein
MKESSQDEEAQAAPTLESKPLRLSNFRDDFNFKRPDPRARHYEKNHRRSIDIFVLTPGNGETIIWPLFGAWASGSLSGTDVRVRFKPSGTINPAASPAQESSCDELPTCLPIALFTFTYSSSVVFSPVK